MITSKDDLFNAGFIGYDDEFISPLTFRYLTGQESGVWMDFNPGSGDFCEVNNYDDTIIVDGDYRNAYGDEIHAILVSFEYSEELAADVLNVDMMESIEAGAGCKKEDFEDLNSEGKKGGFWTLKVKINGEKKTYWFFAPEDWN